VSRTDKTLEFLSKLFSEEKTLEFCSKPFSEEKKIEFHSEPFSKEKTLENPFQTIFGNRKHLKNYDFC
jgi:hypothetical protein